MDLHYLQHFWQTLESWQCRKQNFDILHIDESVLQRLISAGKIDTDFVLELFLRKSVLEWEFAIHGERLSEMFLGYFFLWKQRAAVTWHEHLHKFLQRHWANTRICTGYLARRFQYACCMQIADFEHGHKQLCRQNDNFSHRTVVDHSSYARISKSAFFGYVSDFKNCSATIHFL